MRFARLQYKNITGKEFCKILESQGWVLARINGSHHIYVKEGAEEKITVPVHSNKTLKRGLLKALLKSAGLCMIFGYCFKIIFH